MKSWFDVSTTQMPVFVLFIRAGVLLDNVFSLWVSLTNLKKTIAFTKKCHIINNIIHIVDGLCLLNRSLR